VALIIDPQENEVRALQALGGWRGARVIEIGCGDGRLTQRLARLGAQVDALDPDAGLIRAARAGLPARLRPRVALAVGQAEKLRHRAGTFDRAVFSWVL
jgi:2-polyprenyl-3-methyl-5-hydroxy-6-metoxy-1,4-benzoquinol methylase